MGTSRAIARLYAETLLDVAERYGPSAAEEAAEWLDGLAAALSEARVRAFVRAPTVEDETKVQVLRAALTGTPDWFLAFLRLLAAKGRLAALPEVAYAFRRLLDARRGRQPVEVVVAAPLDEAALETLRQRLERRLGHPVAPVVRVDPRILGGVVIRVGDRRWDGSLRRRLQELRRRLSAAPAAGTNAA